MTVVEDIRKELEDKKRLRSTLKEGGEVYMNQKGQLETGDSKDGQTRISIPKGKLAL